MMKRLIFISIWIVAASMNMYGQKTVVKTNLLQDVTTTLNLGLEFGVRKKTTLDISGSYNPWKFGDARFRFVLIQPEARYWLCEKFNGSFLGLHAHYAHYNVGGLKGFGHNIRHNRYQGNLYGGGFSYGYQWILGDRWNLEAILGVGYARLIDDKYPCASCGTRIKRDHRNYWGPTKAGITLIYILK